MDPRYVRNVPALSEAECELLRRKRVLVVGCGGLGGHLIDMLARIGIGSLRVVDGDVFEPSNLNRQLEALNSTVGLPKAEAVARRVRDINPYAVLHPMEALYNADNREQFFPAGCRYDYIVDAIDLVSCKLDLIEQARLRRIPILTALGTGNKLDPTLLQVADISKTSGCPLARVIRKELRARDIHHLKVVFSPEQPAETQQLEAPPPGRRSVPASVAWVPATAGLLMGSVVIRDLIDGTGMIP